MHFLGAFYEVAKSDYSFVTPVRLSVRMERLGSHWTDFHEIWYFEFFSKIC
jgi:hypothetical protein